MRRRAGGQGLAEFALALPLFILLLFGLLDIGRAVFAYNEVTNAAREAARLAVVNQDPVSVTTRAAAQATGLSITTTATYWQPSPNADPEANDACGTKGIGCIVVVRVTTQYQPITPIASSIMRPIALTAESQMPIEFVCPSTIVGFETAADCPKQP